MLKHSKQLCESILQHSINQLVERVLEQLGLLLLVELIELGPIKVTLQELELEQPKQQLAQKLVHPLEYHPFRFLAWQAQLELL